MDTKQASIRETKTEVSLRQTINQPVPQYPDGNKAITTIPRNFSGARHIPVAAILAHQSSTAPISDTKLNALSAPIPELINHHIDPDLIRSTATLEPEIAMLKVELARERHAKKRVQMEEEKLREELETEIQARGRFEDELKRAREELKPWSVGEGRGWW